MKKILKGLCAIILSSFLIGCSSSMVESSAYEKSHFGFMQGDNHAEIAHLNVHWKRPALELFTWNLIEPEKGKYDWKIQDETVKVSQKYQINILADIQPYADWDQKKCHEKKFKEGVPGRPSYGAYRQKPCNMEDYKSFVKRLVERFDGDGRDDMPGLTMPIKYWEVMNEIPATPASKLEKEATFFGTAKEYVEILKATHEAVKHADPEAKIILGGIAEVLYPPQIKFWNSVMKDGKDYFDIANIHSVYVNIEDFYAGEFKEYLLEQGINKLFWVTEAQLNAKAISKTKLTEEQWAGFMIKSFVRAFANGADKIFYVGLERSPADPQAWLLKNFERQKPYYAFKTMVEKLDYFTSAQKLGEGKYKFIVNDKVVYVVWKEIPSEISGKIKVTFWDGIERKMQSSNLNVTGEPMFIELE